MLPALSKALDIREVFDQLSAAIGGILPHDRMALGLFSDDRTAVRIHAYTGERPANMPETILMDPAHANTDWNYFLVHDIAEDSVCVGEKYNRMKGWGIRSLANEKPTTIEEIVRIAQRLYPARAIPTPRRLPDSALYLAALFMEMASKVSGREPELQRNFLRTFSVPEHADIRKARTELGFVPKAPYRAIMAALRYLAEEHAKEAPLIRRVA